MQKSARSIWALFNWTVSGSFIQDQRFPNFSTVRPTSIFWIVAWHGHNRKTCVGLLNVAVLNVNYSELRIWSNNSTKHLREVLKISTGLSTKALLDWRVWPWYYTDGSPWGFASIQRRYPRMLKKYFLRNKLPKIWVPWNSLEYARFSELSKKAFSWKELSIKITLRYASFSKITFSAFEVDCCLKTQSTQKNNFLKNWLPKNSTYWELSCPRGWFFEWQAFSTSDAKNGFPGKVF